MFFENNYINFSSKLIINSISNYKNIMTQFINYYEKIYSPNYSDKKKLYSDAIIYAKYYLYYKTKNCIYEENIMEILSNVDFHIQK